MPNLPEISMFLRAVAIAFFLLSTFLGAQETDRDFTIEHARHLLNRAGFGGTPEEVEALHQKGFKNAIEEIVSGLDHAPKANDVFTYEPFKGVTPQEFRKLSQDERRKFNQRRQRYYNNLMQRYRRWWMGQFVSSPYPFREKLALFWHGYFTSSFRIVRDATRMMNQIELYREEGLGNFRSLLRRVSKDPAMLRYLDNDRNVKGAPNENYAREVMELFTLGEGHYTEEDVKECARALTGWVNRREGARFLPRLHDKEPKTIFGRSGNYNADDALDVILQRDEAPRWVAQRILAYFVGPEMPDGMVERYARHLRALDWDLKPFFKILFSDPDFYSPTVIGSHIASPVQYLAGISRRLGENPPTWMLVNFSDQLGQMLLDPPNVKGWEGGDAWITTSSLMQRGNFARYLVVGFDRRRVLRDFATKNDDEVSMKVKQSAANKILRGAGRRTWQPLTRMRELAIVKGAKSAEELVDFFCDRFLAVPVTDDARASLIAFMQNEKGNTPARFRRPRALEYSESLLRRLVHLILSLPEAQLV